MTAAPYPIPHDVVTPCADDPDLMFPAHKPSPARIAKATAVCDGCPWREGCLAWGVTRGEEGVWGGTYDDEREAIREEQGIVAEKPSLAGYVLRGPAPRNLIPHGTSVWVEKHRRKYEALCDKCQKFDAARKPVAS